MAELARFLAHRDVVGWVLLGTMLFFSSLAFTGLENAMSVIFHHRVAIRRRHVLISAVLLYLLGLAGEIFVLTSTLLTTAIAVLLSLELGATLLLLGAQVIAEYERIEPS